MHSEACQRSKRQSLPGACSRRVTTLFDDILPQSAVSWSETGLQQASDVCQDDSNSEGVSTCESCRRAVATDVNGYARPGTATTACPLSMLDSRVKLSCSTGSGRKSMATSWYLQGFGQGRSRTAVDIWANGVYAQGQGRTGPRLGTRSQAHVFVVRVSVHSRHG